MVNCCNRWWIWSVSNMRETRWWSEVVVRGDELLSQWVVREKKRRARNRPLKLGANRSVTSDCNRWSTGQWLKRERVCVDECWWFLSEGDELGWLLTEGFCYVFFLNLYFSMERGVFSENKKIMGIFLSWGIMGFWFSKPLTGIINPVITLILCGIHSFHSHL